MPSAPAAQATVVALDAREWDIAAAPELEMLLDQAADCPDAIVDLSSVSYMDSTCLGKIARLSAKRAANGHAPARLVIPSARLRRLFAIVKFDEIWPIFQSLEDARRAGDA